MNHHQCLQHDKFGLVSHIWNLFIENCRMSFNPHENLMVDEQMLPCKANCKFIQYMSNKPDKFGIKFWLLVDLKTKYLCNGFPYLTKDKIKPVDKSMPTFIEMKLMDGFYNQGYNVTTDNFFTSLFLAKKLLEHRKYIPDLKD